MLRHSWWRTVTMLLVHADDVGVDALLDELTSLRASRSSRTRCGLTSGSRSSTAPSCGRSQLVGLGGGLREAVWCCMLYSVY